MRLTAADRESLVRFERDSSCARVLVVAALAETPDFPHGGIFTRRHIDSIRRLGVRCDVMAIAGHRSRFAYAVAAAQLARLSLRGDHRYSLVHAHGGETALAATAYRRAPLLVSYLGSDLLGHPRGDGQVPVSWRLRSAVIRQHSRLAAATITKSAPMEPALPARVRARNHVIPSGVDLELFKPRARDAARAELGWDLEERVILYASNPLAAGKRYPLAQEVTERVARRLGGVRMHVAHRLPPAVMPDVMNASDCLLHPSASEGSPNVVKEALACNLPIVATPVGDVPELLAGVENCFVCAPRADELASAVIKAIDPPARSNGRSRSPVPEEGDIAERVVAVYREITGERALRA